MMAEQDGVGECGPTAPTAYCCPSAAIVAAGSDVVDFITLGMAKHYLSESNYRETAAW